MAIRTKLVQRGTFTIPSGQAGAQSTITAVDLNKAFVKFTYRSANTVDMEAGLLRGFLLGTTDIRVERQTTSAVAITVNWTVVEFTSGSNINVEQVDLFNVTSATTTAITNVGSTTNAFMIASWRDNGSVGGGGSFISPKFNSTTQLGFNIQSGSIAAMSIFVVSSSELSVQHIQTADPTTNTQDDVAISAVTENRSMILSYAKNVGNTEAFSWFGTTEFLNNTTVRWIHGSTASKTIYGQVIEWPSNFVTHWGFAFTAANTTNIAIDAGGVTSIARSYVIDGGAQGISNGRISAETADNFSTACMDYEITTTTNVFLERNENFGRTITATMWVIEDTGPDVDPAGGVRANLNGGLINNGLINGGLIR